MDHNTLNKKEFQEARTRPPKVEHGLNGHSAAFSCVLCNWLLVIPYQSYCGDRACYKCLKLLAQNIKQSGHETIKCLVCGDKIIPDQFFPDKAATRELNTLHVACPKEGCSWEGQYCDYEDHFNKCPQLRVKCAYEQCKEMVLRKNMDKHTKKCGFRPSQCEYCGAETTFNHLQDHWSMCDEFPLPCSEGCGEKVPRGLMKTHVNEDCTMVRRTCRYQTLGCKFDGSGADLLEHEQQYVQYHLRMVWRYQQDTVQHLKVGGTNGKVPLNVDSALTHVDGQITELTRQLGDNLMMVQKVPSETQTYATATEEAITKLQHAVKELQDYYSDLALSVQTLQATSYTGVYTWKVPEGQSTAERDMQCSAATDQKARSRKMVECNFPIVDLLTQLMEQRVLTEFEYEEIQSTPNRVEKNRKFCQFLFRKDERTLERTLSILDQPEYESYRYLGSMLTDLRRTQLQRSTNSPSQHAVVDAQDYYSDLALSVQTLQATSYTGVYILKVPELTRRKRDAVLGKTISLYSAPFFTSQRGYKMCLRVYLNGDGPGRGTHISFFICLMKGEFDPLLPWPFKQTVSLSLLAQDGVSRDITQSFKPDMVSSSFQMPKSEMNVQSGCPQFCSLAVLDNPSYARNDTINLKGTVNIQGIEHIS